MKNISILLLILLAAAITSAQTPKNLSMLGTLNFPGQRLSGCWHYNHLNGKEYAIVGAEQGIAIVDISNPAVPNMLFQLPGATSLWHEVKVLGDYAFAVSEGTDPNGINNGMQIIDLKYLPDSAPYTFYGGDTVISTQLIKAHSITADGDYVYINGHNISFYGNGVLILNVSDPLNPHFVGAVTNRYCHDSYVRGNTLYTSDIHDGMFSVYDIIDRSNPVLLATQITPGQFTHNTWLSDDSLTLYSVDERVSTSLASYDISNLNNITLLDTFFNGNFTNNEVHNVRVFNDYLINPSYGSQLTIADATRPANLIEVANYTTGNSLCWDADPYTLSGRIIATDMNSGNLFIFDPVYRRACYLEGLVTDSITGLPLSGVSIDFDSTLQINKISDLSGNYRTGYSDSGTYVITFTKSGYNTKLISVSLSNGVLTTLNVEMVPVGTGVQTIYQNELTIFPNPVNDVINVNASDVISNWQLFDAKGRLVLQSGNDFISASRLIINVKGLPSGIYHLSVSNGINQSNSRIVIQSRQ